MKTPGKRIEEAYRTLHEAFGPQGWWPAGSRFEMAVGAILTQNTTWHNAELALARLRASRILSPSGIESMTQHRLQTLIGPAGFQERKAKAVRELATAISRTVDGWSGFLKLDGERMRKELLAVWGIGPETADAITLYAGGHPTFVIDKYTKRFAVRHGLVERNARYERVRELFTASLAPDASLFGEYHALLVRLGKEFCQTVPRCRHCPLRRDLTEGEVPAG